MEKKRQKRYYQRHAEEIKARQREYNQRSEVKERRRKYYQRPDVKKREKKRQKEYYQRPEVKKRLKKYGMEYRQRPEVSIRIEKSPFSTIEKYPTHQSQIIRFEVGRKHAENGGNLYDKRIKKSGIEYPSYQT